MRRSIPLILAAAAALSACATAVAPVEVTRFHRLSAPTIAASTMAAPATVMAQGSYRIVEASVDAATSPRAPMQTGAQTGARMGGQMGTQAAAPMPAPSMEWGNYAAAVARQLDALGYTPVAAGAAAGSEAYRVTLSVDRGARASLQRSPVNVGVGGSTGSYGSGVGVGVGINLNSLFGGGNDEVTATRMQVRIVRSGDAEALWEGRAQTEARSRTPAAQPGPVAQKLAEALFRGFPGQSGETITVP